jgi:hypothetical protein
MGPCATDVNLLSFIKFSSPISLLLCLHHEAFAFGPLVGLLPFTLAIPGQGRLPTNVSVNMAYCKDAQMGTDPCLLDDKCDSCIVKWCSCYNDNTPSATDSTFKPSDQDAGCAIKKLYDHRLCTEPDTEVSFTSLDGYRILTILHSFVAENVASGLTTVLGMSVTFQLHVSTTRSVVSWATPPPGRNLSARRDSHCPLY